MVKKSNRVLKDRAWLATQNLSQYSGRWLAIFNQSIVAQGQCLETVVQSVLMRNIKKEDPVYIRVPEGFVTL